MVQSSYVAAARLEYPIMKLSHLPPAGYDRASIEWARRFGLLDEGRVPHLERIACGTAARFGFPSASAELVQVAADLITWLFLFDDAYPEGTYRFDPEGFRAASGRYLDLLSSFPRVEPSTRFGEALFELAGRLHRLAPASWFTRFVESLRYYFSGCLREAELRHSRRLPALEEYLELRRASFGYAPVCDLFELVLGPALTDEERCASEVLRLRQLGADVSAWVNDIYSYEKELAAGDDLNLVRVVELRLGLAPEQASARVGAMHNDALGALVELGRRLEGGAASLPAARRLARAILEWTQGHHDWSLRCTRYDSGYASQYSGLMWAWESPEPRGA